MSLYNEEGRDIYTSRRKLASFKVLNFQGWLQWAWRLLLHLIKIRLITRQLHLSISQTPLAPCMLAGVLTNQNDLLELLTLSLNLATAPMAKHNRK
jgi:hypothetical protein